MGRLILLKIEKSIPNFDENGNLPFGIYDVDFNEFENKFSKGLSKRRKDIMEYYKKHLKEILKCDYVLTHWIGGSFVTLEENPNDIDTLTELDGVQCDANDSRNTIQNFFDYAPLRTENYCHSFCIFKYPEENEIEHELYLEAKSTYLCLIFAKDRLGNPKGLLQLNLQGGGLDEI